MRIFLALLFVGTAWAGDVSIVNFTIRPVDFEVSRTEDFAQLDRYTLWPCPYSTFNSCEGFQAFTAFKKSLFVRFDDQAGNVRVKKLEANQKSYFDNKLSPGSVVGIDLKIIR